MAWIQTIPEDQADGPLRPLYDAAIKRAGRVYQILRIMSPSPETLRASIGFYQTVMLGPSGLSRGLRELLAVVVSKANACEY